MMSQGNKGFTIVELMVAILILGIISSAAAAFVLNFTKSFHVSDALVDLQSEAQIVSNKLSEMIMESDGLYELMLYDDGGILISMKDSYDKQVVDESGEYIAFRFLEEEEKAYHIFTLNKGVLEHSLSMDADLINRTDVEETGGNIESIGISPVYVKGKGEPIQTASLLKLEIELRKEDIDFKTSTQVKYRN